MDPKKSLKPELKDIYEKVMSTKTGARSSTPVSPTSPVKPPTSNEAKPNQATPQTPTKTNKPDVNKQEPFLAGSAPRPVTNMDAFVFSSRGKKSEPPSKKSDKKAAPTPKTEVKSDETNQSSSKLYPVLVVCMFVFIVLWTVFWAIFLGVI